MAWHKRSGFMIEDVFYPVDDDIACPSVGDGPMQAMGDYVAERFGYNNTVLQQWHTAMQRELQRAFDFAIAAATSHNAPQQPQPTHGVPGDRPTVNSSTSEHIHARSPGVHARPTHGVDPLPSDSPKTSRDTPTGGDQPDDDPTPPQHRHSHSTRPRSQSSSSSSHHDGRGPDGGGVVIRARSSSRAGPSDALLSLMRQPAPAQPSDPSSDYTLHEEHEEPRPDPPQARERLSLEQHNFEIPSTTSHEESHPRPRMFGDRRYSPEPRLETDLQGGFRWVPPDPPAHEGSTMAEENIFRQQAQLPMMPIPPPVRLKHRELPPVEDNHGAGSESGEGFEAAPSQVVEERLPIIQEDRRAQSTPIRRPRQEDQYDPNVYVVAQEEPGRLPQRRPIRSSSPGPLAAASCEWQEVPRAHGEGSVFRHARRERETIQVEHQQALMPEEQRLAFRGHNGGSMEPPYDPQRPPGFESREDDRYASWTDQDRRHSMLLLGHRREDYEDRRAPAPSVIRDLAFTTTGHSRTLVRPLPRPPREASAEAVETVVPARSAPDVEAEDDIARYARRYEEYVNAAKTVNRSPPSAALFTPPKVEDARDESAAAAQLPSPSPGTIRSPGPQLRETRAAPGEHIESGRASDGGILPDSSAHVAGRTSNEEIMDDKTRIFENFRQSSPGPSIPRHVREAHLARDAELSSYDGRTAGHKRASSDEGEGGTGEGEDVAQPPTPKRRRGLVTDAVEDDRQEPVPRPRRIVDGPAMGTRSRSRQPPINPSASPVYEPLSPSPAALERIGRDRRSEEDEVEAVLLERNVVSADNAPGPSQPPLRRSARKRDRDEAAMKKEKEEEELQEEEPTRRRGAKRARTTPAPSKPQRKDGRGGGKRGRGRGKGAA